jgi:hypothetical protein
MERENRSENRVWITRDYMIENMLWITRDHMIENRVRWKGKRALGTRFG